MVTSALRYRLALTAMFVLLVSFTLSTVAQAHSNSLAGQFHRSSTHPLAQAKQITISSTTGWQLTTLTLNQGDQYTIAYLSGTWTVDYRNWPKVGPAGYLWDEDQKIYQGCKYDPLLTYATLLGGIGNGSDFAIGNGGVFTASASGSLYLRINDQDACLGDNSGSIKLTVLAAGSGTTVNVDGTQPWTDTGIDLVSGESVSIRASGIVWMADGPAVPYNPDGNPGCQMGQGSPGPGLYCYSLIGMIGSNGIPFQLGSRIGFQALFSGRLYLGVNDNVFSDNHSSWQANVVIPNPTTSPFWAGYQVHGPNPYTQTFSTVQGSWRQPKALSCAANENSSAYFWVGLGGAFQDSRALEQIGTEIICTNGKVTNQAFYEFWPAPLVSITTFIPNYNDLITATVSVVGQNLYALKIVDVTQKKHYSHTFSQAGGETNSAEWIAENAGGGPFTNFGRVTFFKCTVDGYSIISATVVDEVTLNPSYIKAVPSALYTRNGEQFDVTWLQQ